MKRYNIEPSSEGGGWLGTHEGEDPAGEYVRFEDVEAEIEGLRKQALIWHEWPVEKPMESKWYLVEEVDEHTNRPFDDRLGMEWWIGGNSRRWLTRDLRAARWAEVPKSGRMAEHPEDTK